jgi:hypothetical protein
MEKMIIISSKQGTHDYLKKIINSANKITRKYFIEHINEKFDPDLIYTRVLKLIEEKDKIIQ